jgi:hypothetical protein
VNPRPVRGSGASGSQALCDNRTGCAGGKYKKRRGYEQLDLFTDYMALEQQRKKENEALEREKKMQHAMVDIRKKFGKNAILKGMNLEEGATARERNRQIGGHKA